MSFESWKKKWSLFWWKENRRKKGEKREREKRKIAGSWVKKNFNAVELKYYFGIDSFWILCNRWIENLWKHLVSNCHFSSEKKKYLDWNDISVLIVFLKTKSIMVNFFFELWIIKKFDKGASCLSCTNSHPQFYHFLGRERECRIFNTHRK